MSGLVIMKSDVRMTVKVTVSVQHVAVLKEAVDMARVPVARIISEKLGYIVEPGKPVLDDWDVEGNCGDKNYRLQYSFEEVRGHQSGFADNGGTHFAEEIAIGTISIEELARR